jgi:hypothetical protein
MKKWAICAAMGLGLVGSVGAAPLRVALVDFEDQTGMGSDALLGGTLAPGALADKGALLLGKRMAASPAISLIDRRDFTRQIEQQPLTDAGVPTTVRPSVLHAAQALRADAVVRGSILSFSTGKQIINQGGYSAELAQVTMRVALEAQNAVDGAVIAIADGAAQIRLRQTDAVQTVLSEDEVLGLMEQAIDETFVQIEQNLVAWQAAAAARPTIRLSVKTDADPALVEIDGILVGTTPMDGHEVYVGDHVLRVGKPGYYDLTKRILFEQDTAIEVPMLKTELSADELAEVLKTIRMHAFVGEPGMIINTIRDADWDR